MRGLPPQVKREVFPPDDLTGGHARAVLGLMEEIRRDPQGGADVERLTGLRIQRHSRACTVA